MFFLDVNPYDTILLECICAASTLTVHELQTVSRVPPQRMLQQISPSYFNNLESSTVECKVADSKLVEFDETKLKTFNKSESISKFNMESLFVYDTRTDPNNQKEALPCY